MALTMADYSKDESTFIFPQAAVLYLRTETTTPSSIRMKIVTPGGDVSYEIPVVKVQDYGLEEIFEKRLLFLLPYREGESLALKLIQLLIQQGRTDDVTRASIDPKVRQQLYREFHLI